VTEEDLKEEQKQVMEKAIEDYRQLCLKSFSLNRSGEVIQKQDLPLPRQVTFDSNPGKLQEMVNSAINHALTNHSNVLSNTIYNAMIRTFKEGQAPPLYARRAYHQPELSSVSAPSAPSAVAGTEVTSTSTSAGVPNDQSAPMRSDPMPSGGRVQLNTDLSASAMSESVFQNGQVPPNWWGYGMPPEFFAVSSGLSQVSGTAGKAPVPSAPLVSPMTQVPQYATSTTMRPMPGGFQMPSFQVPNASSSVYSLPTQQRTLTMNRPVAQFMSQASYVNPAMTANDQPLASFVLMNANNGWLG